MYSRETRRKEVNMANKEVKNTNKAVEEAKAVVKQEEAKGTPNNAGQEIEKLQPSEVVTTCTMTDEEHEARKSRIRDKQEQGLRLSWDIMADIVSANERHEHTLDGYEDTAKGFLEWANTEFSIGDTQVKQAIRIMGIYGTIDDKGEYTIEEKYKRYTKEKLDIIQRFPAFKTKSNFDDIVESLGIMPSTSEGVLKEMVREAKGLPAPANNKDNKDDNKDNKKDAKTLQKELDGVQADKNRLERLHNVESKTIGDIVLILNNEKLSDKDFRQKVREIIDAMGKDEKKETEQK